jgi:hypothetical protein
VLTVKLPFREEAKPRTINVEVAAEDAATCIGLGFQALGSGG